jgi:acetyl-CoA carboxylase carboxyltransferase component
VGIVHAVRCCWRRAAQTIRDFNGEGLPLFIFANWRGFSGGQRDMFDQVLKFGAYIVDGAMAACLIGACTATAAGAPLSERN